MNHTTKLVVNMTSEILSNNDQRSKTTRPSYDQNISKLSEM